MSLICCIRTCAGIVFLVGMLLTSQVRCHRMKVCGMESCVTPFQMAVLSAIKIITQKTPPCANERRGRGHVVVIVSVSVQLSNLRVNSICPANYLVSRINQHFALIPSQVWAFWIPYHCNVSHCQRCLMVSVSFKKVFVICCLAHFDFSLFNPR